MNGETKIKFKERLLQISRDIIQGSRLEIIPENIDKVFYYYTRYNERTHSEMSKIDALVDSHKIAACFLFSIIKAEPLAFTITDKNKSPDTFPSFKEHAANEMLGFIFGLYILKIFIEKEAKTPEEIFIAQKEIELPICKGKTQYTHHFIQIISKENIDIENKDFNQNIIFIFSHIFFLIEKFNYHYWLSFYKQDK
ncbi:hypothetical protein [Leptospira sp. 'Mane']|uniref:hypothetical protein n=1 Tax=Leptospira sp. 'Mane' TaxID=3387407 RepID=UPI00398B2480